MRDGLTRVLSALFLLDGAASVARYTPGPAPRAAPSGCAYCTMRYPLTGAYHVAPGKWGGLVKCHYADDYEG